jgi:hypothetical protein
MPRKYFSAISIAIPHIATAQEVPRKHTVTQGTLRAFIFSQSRSTTIIKLRAVPEIGRTEF